MGRFIEIAIAALLGAIVAIVGSAFFLGHWGGRVETLENSIHSLDSRMLSVEKQIPTFIGFNSNDERATGDGDLFVLKNGWGQERSEADMGKGRVITKMAVCPRGHFVTGVTMLDGDTGKFRTGCLTIAKLTCASI